jgi:archaeoflavoprotein AfpA
MTLKILWGITGCGDKLEETVHIMKKLQKKHNIDVRVTLSKNGEIVVRMYNLWQSLQENFKKVMIERGPNAPFLVAPLQIGKYDFFLICPATANTTAKIAHGIADSLISNCASQALKAGTKVYIYPVDQKPGKITTVLPNGEKLTLTIRKIDVENAEKLKRMMGIAVLSQPEDIEEIIKEYLIKQ